MRKNIIFLLTLLCLLVIPAVSATNSYVVLTPGSDATSYYDSSFENTAISINNSASLENNSVVVYFNDTNISDVNATIASYNPDYLFFVIQPSNATPQLLDDVGDMLKTLDSDPFIDVAWGVITGDTNVSAYGLYGRTMSWSNKKYFAVPFGDIAIKNANFLYSRLTSNKEIYSGNTATSSNIYDIFNIAPIPDLFYYSTSNITDYNQYSSYDNEKCFIANTTELALWCLGSTNIVSMLNTFVVSDTPESGRVSGGEITSDWYFGKNTTAKYNQSFLINTIDLGAAAILAPYSDVWTTHEMLSKNVVNEVFSSSKLGVAAKTAKNIVLLNLEKESNISDKTFLKDLEKQYVFYGNPKLDGDTNSALYTITTPTPKIYGLNHVIGENFTWNMSIIITPTATGSIYTNSWQQSSGSVWYKNITSIDSENKTNITILGALSGVVSLDDSIYNKTFIPTTAYFENKTVFTLRINQTNTTYVKNETIQTDTFYSGINDNEIYFSILYSPNETLTVADTRTLNFTIQTSGLTQNSTEVSTIIQNITANLSVKNPTSWSIPNVTIVYEVPFNVTTGCIVSGSNAGICNITTNNTKQFANFTVSSLGTSTTNYNLIYMTGVYANTTVINSIGNITDRGDTLTYDANISTTLQNNSFADVNITLYRPDGNISWQNQTSDVNINNTNSFIFQRVWVVPSNATSGQYRIEINAVDNVTQKGIYTNSTYFDVTNQLEFYVGNVTNTVNIAPIKHTDGTDWYFMEDDDVVFSGFLRDLNGNNINGTVNATIEGIGQDNSTTFGLSGFSVEFNWSSVALGTHNLTIIAVDDNKNTATYKQPIHISNYANKTTVVVSGGSNNVYEAGMENVTINVTVFDSNGIDKVYLGDVTVSGDNYGSPKTKQTDANGVATFTFTAPKTTLHSYTVTARSPLNTSTSAKVVNQTGTLDATHFGIYRSAWIYYDELNITPENPEVGQDITIAGEIYFSNKTACTSGSVNVKVKKGSYERNVTITFTNITAIEHKFSHEFEYTSDIGHATDVNFVADDWTYIFDGTLASCTYYNRTFTNVTSDDPTTSRGTFKVVSNVTTTSSDSSTSSSDTTSSDNSDTCDDNSDCSSGDYCSSSNVCKPISCDDGIILDHVCISAYKISLSEYPKTIYIEQGKSDKFDLNIKNTGYKNLTDLSLLFTIPTSANWTNWYSITNISVNLEADEDTQMEATFNIPEIATIMIYPVMINVSSAEKTYEETMNIQVLPGDKEKIIINKSLENLSVEIIAAKEELEKLMNKLENGDITLANSKLNTIENLHAQALAAISDGDYLTAYNQEKEITTLLTQVKSLMTESQIMVASTKIKTNMVVSVLILIVLFAGIIYYLWVPAPGYVPGKKMVSASIPYARATKKTKEVSFLLNVKNRLNELIDDYKKQKEKEANAPEKYDFHKKNRWS